MSKPGYLAAYARHAGISPQGMARVKMVTGFSLDAALVISQYCHTMEEQEADRLIADFSQSHLESPSFCMRTGDSRLNKWIVCQTPWKG